MKQLPANSREILALYWLQVAEIERSELHSSDAEAATQRALEPFLRDPPDTLAVMNFFNLYQIAMKLMASGEADKAKRLSDRFDLMIDAIRPEIPAEYIEPRSLAAALCAKLNDFDCSAREITAAYFALQQHISQSSTAALPPSSYDMASDYIVLGHALGTMALLAKSPSAEKGERTLGR